MIFGPFQPPFRQQAGTGAFVGGEPMSQYPERPAPDAGPLPERRPDQRRASIALGIPETTQLRPWRLA